MKKFILLPAVLLISACASIVSGTEQDITVNTTPAGADCALVREGQTIARVSSTPGTVTVDKTKHNINVVCNKPGYQTGSFLNESGTEGSTAGNILAGGLIGWGIDSARGADNKYDEGVNITLVPLAPVPTFGTSPYLQQPPYAQPQQQQPPLTGNSNDYGRQ
jgi:hypothetical protein